MLGELILAIFSYIKKGNYQEASRILNDAYLNLLKQEASFFHKLDINEMTRILIKEHNYTNGHLEVLAELFYAEAELRFHKNEKAGSLIFYQKALKLFDFIEKENKTFSLEKLAKIERIKSRIEVCKDEKN